MLIKKKYKICRRLGDSVFNKCQAPGFSRSLTNQKSGFKKRGRKSRSEYSSQLTEKQRARLTYIMKEGQFVNYVKKAEKTKGGNPADHLSRLLEKRLDNVLFRSGLGLSRGATRQMISHGHIVVNNKKVTVPSYQVNVGDKISIRNESREKTIFKNTVEKLKNYKAPNWLKTDPGSLQIEVISEPERGHSDLSLNLNAVMEFYSRT